MTAKILAFAGSARVDSYNKKLVKIAANGAKAAGGSVTLLDLRDLPMPLFDEELEANEGLPLTVLKFKELMKSHDGFLIASPEYNSSISGLLKNAIDWASRPAPNEAGLACFTGKVAGLMSASPGGLGGLRGLVHVRAILGNIRVLVIPEQKAISHADEAFNLDGSLVNSKDQADVENIGVQVVRLVNKILS